MSRLRVIVVSGLVIAGCLTAAEAARRVLDGFYVWRVGLVRNPQSPDLTWSDGRPADALFKTIPIDIEADANWFYDRPPGTAPPSRSWLDDRRETNGPEANYVWNATRLGDAVFRDFLQQHRNSLADVFVFRPPDNSPFPRYRLYPEALSGFGPTNRFGWRSGPIATEKPPNVIRIGVLGDSTTNEYPALVEHWLNLWSKRRRLGVRFEVMNAARPGTGPLDAAGILAYELAPSAPDYVILYGFGNGIWFVDDLVQLPPGVRRGLPGTWKAGDPGIVARLSSNVAARLEPAARWSAAAGFLRDRVTGRHGDGLRAEPPKPLTELRFPPGIDEMNPDPETIAARPSDEGFMSLETYLQALDTMDALAKARNIRLFVSTFRILAFDGMRAGGNLYRTINEDYWWPYTYTQIQRLIAFYNRALRNWAQRHGQRIVDIDGKMPRLPHLYGDGMHELAAGEALHAWVVLQELMPRIRADLAARAIPTPGRSSNWDTAQYWTIERLRTATVLATAGGTGGAHSSRHEP